ncbi:hypothetical protein [Pengzhenrongella frigida]|uniref:DUF3592 domain-containing protein n=1 Tax=Pengzhenrongella frigida TaxID=1259133 RepID=A0A4Q5N4T1_9MICO|nr:hypothetical protein [Cellulomonas sp. HLT2-17]RYV51707.1 hypothetical protein EUA98_07340 [Cellulomonas sp. HLT2-17]
MNPLVWIAPTCLFLAAACFIVGGRLVHRARRVDRVQLPARLRSRVWLGPGYSLVLEYPGPDGQPRIGSAFAFIRRGLGATPAFGGWVWVNRADPADVMTRPGGRTAPGGTVLIGGAIFLFASLGTGLAAVIVASTSAIGGP